MTTLITEPTQLAGWRQLVIEAQTTSHLTLPESIENYVVLTLNAFMKESSLQSAVAFDFLTNIHIHSVRNTHRLRYIGDKCLILSGLFPEYFKRKNLTETYYINIGKQAYYTLSITSAHCSLDHTLFHQLFETFTDLTVLLKAMRIKLLPIMH